MILFLSAVSSALLLLAFQFAFSIPFNVSSFIFTTASIFALSILFHLAGRSFYQRHLRHKATGHYSASQLSRNVATCCNCFYVWTDRRAWTRCPECDAMLVPWFIAPEHGFEFKAGGRPRSERV